MKWPSPVFALSLVMGATVHLPAAASPSAPAGPANVPTYSEAFKKFGEPSNVYIDGKSDIFFVYRLKGGRRLAYKLMANLGREKGDLLPLSWKPPHEWREVKMWEARSRLHAKPQAARPPSQTPPDRYHPGVRLLARSGQG